MQSRDCRPTHTHSMDSDVVSVPLWKIVRVLSKLHESVNIYISKKYQFITGKVEYLSSSFI